MAARKTASISKLTKIRSMRKIFQTICVAKIRPAYSSWTGLTLYFELDCLKICAVDTPLTILAFDI